MKIVKRLLIIAATIIMLCVISVVASAATYGYLTYTVNNGEATITDCSTSVSKIEIPEEINGYPVTSIGYGAFENCQYMTSITIPDSVVSIGNSAFSHCINMKSITIPDSVVSIGNSAFFHCVNMTTITIGKSVANIGSQMFSYCSSLTNIIVDENNENFCSDNGVLFNKDKTTLLVYPAGKTQTEYVIPDFISTIDSYAFEYCSTLISITIGESVETIGNFAFNECSNLTEISLPDKIINMTYGTFRGSKYFNDSSNWTNKALYIGNHLVATEVGYITHVNEEGIDFSVKEGTRYIADGVFGNTIRSVYIPDSVVYISEKAFTLLDSSDLCPASEMPIQNVLQSINVNENNLYYSSDEFGVLYNKDKTVLIRFPGALKTTEYVIPDTVTSIGNYAFHHTAIDSLEIPDNVVSIGDYAFSWAALKNLTISSSVKSIGKMAFPYSLAFMGSSLRSISVDENNPYFSNDENGVIYNKDKTKLIYCPAGYRGIYDIPDSVTEIGDYAIGNCHNFRLNIPDSVKKIGKSIFPYQGDWYSCYTNGYSVNISIHYYGLKGQWKNIQIDNSNNAFICDGYSYVINENMGMSINLEFYYVCSDDNPHNFSSIVTPPTCTEQGYTAHTCSGCNKSYIDNYFAATGHKVVTDKAVAATCTQTGLTEGSHCTRCDDATVVQNVTVALGHDIVVDKAVAATCTQTGLTEGSHCSRCNDATVAQNVTDALGHDIVVDKAVAATCTETGLTEGSHCSVCNAVIKAQKTVAATGHKAVTDKAVAATCTETGLTEGSHCSVCNAVIKAQKTVAATGHKAVTDKAVAATCTTKGLTEGSHCSSCNTVIKAQKTVAAIGHKVVTDKAVAATCTTKGLTEGSHCSACNTVIKAQKTVAATGHDYVSVVTAPTCTAKGFTTYTCPCGDTYTADEVTALGHTFGEWIVLTAPTASAGEVEERACTACGEKETRSIEKLNFIMCDIDNDGKVTPADARLVLRISAGLETLESYIVPIEAIDMDGDGKIAPSDARTVLRKAVGLE